MKITVKAYNVWTRNDTTMSEYETNINVSVGDYLKVKDSSDKIIDSRIIRKTVDIEQNQVTIKIEKKGERSQSVYLNVLGGDMIHDADVRLNKIIDAQDRSEKYVFGVLDFMYENNIKITRTMIQKQYNILKRHLYPDKELIEMFKKANSFLNSWGLPAFYDHWLDARGRYES